MHSIRQKTPNLEGKESRLQRKRAENGSNPSMTADIDDRGEVTLGKFNIHDKKGAIFNPMYKLELKNNDSPDHISVL